MTRRDRDVVRRFKRLLARDHVPLVSTTLFGSRARGDAEAGSDYDVLVVVDGADSHVRTTVHRCAWEAGLDRGLVIVPVVVTRDEAERGPLRSSLLMQAVREEGVPV